MRCAGVCGGEGRATQRHLVLNTLVTDWNDHEAHAVTDVLPIQPGSSGWSIELVRRYHDTLQRVGGAWRFQHRFADFVTPP